MKIFKSVGKNGANEYADVKVVQACLNAYVKLKKGLLQPLKEDGRCGAKTIDAIGVFQKHYVGLANPDCRVDPNGRTMRYLSMHSSSNAKKAATTKNLGVVSCPLIFGMENQAVSYANDVKVGRRLVSPYAISVVKMALKESGMTHAVITSTLRTPDDQAAIMLKNAKINLASQKRMYAAPGRAVLSVYENNKSKTDNEILELMTKKIKELMDENLSVSNHCFSIEKYSSKNVFDIGFNSTKAKSLNFNKEKFTSALNDLVRDGYVSKVIDETAKSNKCWHLEIVPNSQRINYFDDNSILFPIKTINGVLV